MLHDEIAEEGPGVLRSHKMQRLGFFVTSVVLAGCLVPTSDGSCVADNDCRASSRCVASRCSPITSTDSGDGGGIGAGGGGSGVGGGSGFAGGSGGAGAPDGRADAGTSLCNGAQVGFGADHCVGSITVGLDASVQGCTCSGKPIGTQSPCQIGGHPDVFVTVDAPPGVALRLKATPGYSILGFLACDSVQTSNCQFGGNPTNGPFDAPADMRVFAIERVDAMCGPFTLSVSAR